jgi:hypothetical protein
MKRSVAAVLSLIAWLNASAAPVPLPGDRIRVRGVTQDSFRPVVISSDLFGRADAEMYVVKHRRRSAATTVATLGSSSRTA